MATAADVDLLVELAWVKGSDSRTDMPDTVSSGHGTVHIYAAAKVTLHVDNARVLPGTGRLGKNVERHDSLRPSLHQHLY
mmetsp:Transcript_14560/g.34629  ORF Transcript_14560/g.34629 Transcript_14560/m.34629 type:complete len:80 (+) Transcript_14560:963-1202(+)